jgi:hypothetical protein
MSTKYMAVPGFTPSSEDRLSLQKSRSPRIHPTKDNESMEIALQHPCLQGNTTLRSMSPSKVQCLQGNTPARPSPWKYPCKVNVSEEIFRKGQYFRGNTPLRSSLWKCPATANVSKEIPRKSQCRQGNTPLRSMSPRKYPAKINVFKEIPL